MKLVSITIFSLVFVLISMCVGLCTSASAQVQVIGPIEDVTFGPLINSPNGHISFQKEPGGYRVWLPGRLSIRSQNVNQEGGFMFDIEDWSIEALAQGQPTFMDIGHVPNDCDPSDFSFDRNYAAPNAVIQGNGPIQLAFYDAEYHVACPNGNPLLSSIGLATSNDSGVSWHRQDQIIQGLDQARKGFTFVTQKQLNEFNNGRNLDDGASGPSAVAREADGDVYIYLYYADRTPITAGPDSIYVARALLTSNGMPGSWQQWTATGWGAIGDQTSAVSIVVPTDSARSALQPHVSWNIALQRWLMVFKTKIDFEVATSVDGINWSQASSLLTFDPNDNETGFPTLITPNVSACEGPGCTYDDSVNPPVGLTDLTASQQLTGVGGWLFYSSHPENDPQYHGHRARFRIMGSAMQ